MTRAAALAILVLLSACTRAKRSEPTDDSAGLPKDCDGELVLAVPELPFELQQCPSGGVLVVDRGGLVLRSEDTFAVVRHLAPGIDGWHKGAFVGTDAGVIWRGETFDGHRYDVDVLTGRPTRLYDARVSK